MRIRFDRFEADTQSGELRRDGLKVRLQQQPFQLLVALLDRAGEVVTRDELQRRLWPADTFVDFDQGLNKAVNGLRFALRDRLQKPRFIETLPRRGYRFIGQLERDETAVPVLQVRSLAVLPLENLSSDAGEEYFSDGMTEELICALAKIRGLRVISRTSVMAYKRARRPLPEIAKQLQVDAVVEGTVVRVDGKVRITAQLIYAPEDRHLWSGRYERDLRDVLLLQAEIARGIAHEIRQVVEPADAEQHKVVPEAYESRLKGIYFRDRMTPGDLLKSVEFFLRAIELVPEDAEARGELAQAYFYLGLFGVDRPSVMASKAREQALAALRIDEGVAAAHNAMASVHVLGSWDWARAEEECRRAVELKPGQSVTHAALADYISIQGRHEEAIEEFGRVLDLDPISRMYLGHSALVFYRARRYDEAVAQCRKALEVDASYANALWFLALAQEGRGQLTESVAALEKAAGLSKGRHYQALLARAYALTGQEARARQILDCLMAASRENYVSPLDIAVVQAGLGEVDATFEWLEEAYRQQVFRIIEITTPMFEGLREDERWESLVRRIGLWENGSAIRM